MDIPIVIFVAQVTLTTAATASSVLFLTVVYTTYFPLHVKTIFACLIVGSGSIAFGHLGLLVTELLSGHNIFSGGGEVYWCQLVNAFGLSIHPIAFFILSLDSLILAAFPYFLDFLNRFSRLISIFIASFCIGYAFAFTVIIHFTHYGFYLAETILCITLLTMPIACIGYCCIRTKYRRTVAVLKLNLSTIRELSRVVYPIAIVDALLTAIAFTSAVLVTYRMIPHLVHNRIYRNTLSVQSLLTTWLFLIRHRDFKRRLCSYVNCCRTKIQPSNKAWEGCPYSNYSNIRFQTFIADKTDPIVAMETAWKMRTASPF